MKVHRRFAVFGSRFLFFALAPWLIVCIPLFPYMAFISGKGIGTVLLSGMASASCTLGLLVAIDSWRFIRLTIGLLLMVPAVYIWYFSQTFFVEGMSFTPSFRFSESTPFSAFLGFMVWGMPSIVGACNLVKKAKRVRMVEEKLYLRKLRAR